MKVLFIDQISSVNWKYSFSLVNALHDENVDVVLATDFSSDNAFCKCKTIRLFNTDDKKTNKINKLLNYIKAYKSIIKYVKENKIDIVHLEWITFSPIDYKYIKKLRKYCKVVMTIHDIIAFDSHFYDKIFYKKIYQLPDSIILQTEENQKKFSKLFPKVDPKKIHMCYHGNFLDFTQTHEMEESRQKLALPKDAFIYLFFGQIKAVKGVDLLIKAFSEVAKNHADVYLVIAGNVWHNDFKPYMDLIINLGLQSRIRADIKFISDEDVGYYFSSANIVCLPYTELFQSGVVQLSYSYKKPAIVSNLPAFLTVVEKNKSGFVFKTGDYEDLAVQMEQAYKNQSNLDKMGMSGYNFIKEKYSWKKIANQISVIYRDLLEDKQ